MSALNINGHFNAQIQWMARLMLRQSASGRQDGSTLHQCTRCPGWLATEPFIGRQTAKANT
jgi:hypothetical protein